MQPPVELIELARFVGDPTHDLCIEAEGNVSCAGPNETLWIKGSGFSMKGIHAEGFACCTMAPVLDAVRASAGEEVDARAILNASKVDRGKALPSTETFMHALLLNEAKFVAHSHPTPILSLVCRPDAERFVDRRLFPDEIVLLGPATCFVPYVAPGLPLAKAIAERADAFRQRFGMPPKTLWLQNHGLIVTGQTIREASSACGMAVKAARVLLGCLQSGVEPKWLTDEEIDQISTWPDEHARQRALWGS